MRVGIDARPLISKNLAGIGTYLDQILSNFAKLDSEDEFILYSHKPFEVNREYGENFKIRIIPYKQGTIWLRYKLKKVLIEDAIDVFWGTEFVIPHKLTDIKTILTIHDLALVINPKWGKLHNAIIQNTIMRFSSKEANLIIAVSNSTKNDILRILEIAETKVAVILNGGIVKEKENYSIEDKCLDEIEKSFFLYVGTIEPRKNIITIIKAFETFCDKNKNVDLVIAGGKGWKCSKIIEAIEKSPYREKIHVPGFITNERKRVLLRECIAFVFPSEYEGFGIPVLEAMENNAIVITSNNSSLPEVAGDAAMYLKDNHDSVELANILEAVYLMSETERDNMIAKGIRQAEKFSWEKCARETLDVLKNTEGKQ